MNHELKKKVHQINKGIYPKGYKISNIGIHPKEWEVKTLSQVGKVSSGSTPLRLRSEYYNGDIPWVKTTDLNNSYIYRTEEKINEIAIKKTSVKWVEENSILVAMYGGFNQIGRTGLLKVRGTTNQAISSLFVDEVNYNSEFILHWLNFKKWFWKRYAGSSRKDPNITKKDIENFPLVKPSYPEQQKVARILSTWDKAIELKEKLIVEKKKQKKGLMQKLLTGEIRLPGFFGGWEEVKLSSISTINKGEQLNKIDMIDDGKYPVINGGISLSGYTNKWNKESNTITISEGGQFVWICKFH